MTITTLLALTGAEVAVRLGFSDEIDTKALEQRYAGARIKPFIQPADSGRLVYELKPGVDLTFDGSRVVTDSEGACRVAPPSKPPGEGATRVALLGDSTAFGWKVEYEESYGDLLRAEIERQSGKEVWLRNFAVPGYNSYQNRVTLETRVLPWSPDLVILHYDHNDSDPVGGVPLGMLPPGYGDNPFRSALVKLAARRLRVAWTRHLRTSATDGTGESEGVYEQYRFSGAQYERHLGELQKFMNAVNRQRVPTLVFIFYAYPERSESWRDDPVYRLLSAPIARRFEEWGAYVVDSYPAYQGLLAAREWQSAAPLQIGPRDGHPNAEGHRVIASFLIDKIRSEPVLARAVHVPPSSAAPLPGM